METHGRLCTFGKPSENDIATWKFLSMCQCLYKSTDQVIRTLGVLGRGREELDINKNEENRTLTHTRTIIRVGPNIIRKYVGVEVYQWITLA